MYLAPTYLKSTIPHNRIFAKSAEEQSLEMYELVELAERFRNAHTKLNDIELKLHDAYGTRDRLALLQNLEVARMDYSDARFALSTRNIISNR